MSTVNAAVLGASGYTGSELVRLLSTHPSIRVAALTADRRAGKEAGDVFAHYSGLDLPKLTRIEEVDFAAIDLAFCALPHGLTQDVVPDLPNHLRIVDLSADFRIHDPDVYAEWYGKPHRAVEFQPQVAYGLPEIYRDRIRAARVVACTGCYVASSLLPLIPLVRDSVIDPDDISIDAKSGASGAGRSSRESLSFCEVAEGCAVYGLGGHRHLAEIEQELALAAGRELRVGFTPHLLPYSRGILATIYVRGEAGVVWSALDKAYQQEPFVQVLPLGRATRTHDVRGSNTMRIVVAEDRRPDYTVVVSVSDNLVKGASGQAVQNANIMLGLDETSGLPAAPMVP